MKAKKYTVQTNGEVAVALFTADMSHEEVQTSPALSAYGDGATATFIEEVDINTNNYMESAGEFVPLENYGDVEEVFDDWSTFDSYYY